MDAAIATVGLTKQFGTRLAVDHLEIEVPRGQIFGFLGPNGAGKTTTIGMLLGLIRPTSGQAIVLGYNIATEPERALSAVGAMIEAPAFYPYLSGRDNLRILARSGGLPFECADAALATVDLAERAHDKFRAYSQGMRQRLAIAAALLNDPQLIILDEPTNGLDPAGQRDIRDLIRTLAQRGHTIFLSSHVLHEVEQLCDQIAILKAGRVLAQGAVAELLQRGRGVFVRVDGDTAHAAELLRTANWVRAVELVQNGLRLDVAREDLGQISRLLAEHGILVTELRADERHLEDFFLETTKTP